MKLPVLSISWSLAWHLILLGVHIDAAERTVYLFPLPMLCIRVRWRMEVV